MKTTGIRSVVISVTSSPCAYAVISAIVARTGVASLQSHD
jgi:hypothetical protein